MPPFPSRLHPALLLTLGFALVVFIAGASVWLVTQADRDSERAVQTFETKEKLARLQSLVWQAESNQRSYLLTGDLRYRQAFRADAQNVDAALTQLEFALAESSGQGDRSALVGQLDAAVAAELSRLEQSAAERERSGRAAPAPASALAGSRAEEIRELISKLIQQQQQALKGELGASRGTAQLLLIATLISAFLIVVLAATSISMVRRSTGRLIAAQRDLEEANDTLEEAVARRTTELRRANEEIQNFAYVVSHDLRSPLVNIMGFTSELEIIRKDLFGASPGPRAEGEAADSDESLGRDFDEALSFIKSSISRMDRLIKAILKLTREGRRELRPEWIDMTGLVRSIAEGLGYQAQMSRASIEVEPLPPFVGDRLAVEQIFGNLLENALKYLRDDTPGQIRVSGHTAASGLVYEVQDNGRGIEAKDLDRIFEIFRRSGPQDRPGEGIGLTHVRTLAHRLGGTITVRSEPGQGSTFVVTLPSRPATALPEKSL
ncbi:ATP-binding protein [Mesorhizobium sp. WSM2239]|uniref:histidine kinase n=2 Tax=unclassified Mesorhizobium TaxID=325217 RepID=A0AAU8DFZ0_9HYPH